MAIVFLLLMWALNDWLYKVERDRAAKLQKALDAIKPCQQVAVEQCAAWWFNGDPTAKFDQYNRICGKRR